MFARPRGREKGQTSVAKWTPECPYPLPVLLKTTCFLNAPEKRRFPVIFSSRFVANRQQSHVLALPYYFGWFHGVSGHLKIDPGISVSYSGVHQKRGVFETSLKKIIFTDFPLKEKRTREEEKNKKRRREEQQRRI